MTTSTSGRPGTHTVAHTVNRLTIDAAVTFEGPARTLRVVGSRDRPGRTNSGDRNGRLDAVKRYTAEHTPHTFARFWTFDPTPMMRLVGHSTEVITYMMGNNVVVEQMYRHDPAVMLYAPLRAAIYTDSAGATHFSIDQPSTRFASFGDPRIAEVGRLLES